MVQILGGLIMQSISQPEQLGFCSECGGVVWRDTAGKIRWDLGHESCEGARIILPEEDKK